MSVDPAGRMQLWKAQFLVAYLLLASAISMYAVVHLWALGADGAAREPRLLLLVVFTGALGSCVYALKSVADYIGERKLQESWFVFYLIQPAEGAGIAFIFYVALRGGLFSDIGADSKLVNPYGLSAIAALVGVFSDMAFAKLREIFETMVRPIDTRSGRISEPLAESADTPAKPRGSEGK